ncbi:MAG: hypothetical protein HRU17_12265 [Polyangiaceae bacterium]|nr:hypothetical protein [Polyangiaceae bacterium]
MCDWGSPKDLEHALETDWNSTADHRVRREVIKSVCADLTPVAQSAVMYCAQAVVLSKGLPVGDGVLEALPFMYNRYDGLGGGPVGDELSVVARICGVAADTAVLLRSLGKQQDVELMLPRRGGQHCPECIDL